MLLGHLPAYQKGGAVILPGLTVARYEKLIQTDRRSTRYVAEDSE